MCESSDRDEIDACVGVGSDGLERDSARCLEEDAVAAWLRADEAHGFRQPLGRHVVEKDGVDAAIHGFLQVVERADLDFDPKEVADALLCSGDRLPDAAGEGDVVVLDEAPVVEAKSMIASSTDEHGIFVEETKTRRGLSCIHDLSARPFDGIRVTLCHSCDSGHPLDQVERDALAHQEDLRQTFDPRELLSRLGALAVVHERFELHPGLEVGENGFRHFESGDDQGFFREEPSRPLRDGRTVDCVVTSPRPMSQPGTPTPN